MMRIAIEEGEGHPLAPALDEMVKLYPWRFASNGEVSIKLIVDREVDEKGWRLERDCGENGWRLVYGRSTEAFRALGWLMGVLERGGTLRPAGEAAFFESTGVMVDLSRNNVLRPGTLRRMICKFSLMGINRLFLYMEDTYTIDDEPLFGCFRGAYTAEELREIDRYAALFEMEVVPFIQTLGHLGQVLQWPAYAGLQDTMDVMQAGLEETERVIAKMVRAASAPFRSRRIHIGMDEAHGVGMGRYRLRNGFVPPFDVVSGHLARVAAICEGEGLRPMIWSDMFFRLGSRTEDYYDRESVIPDEVRDAIPAGVDLVYWDYYHTDAAFYREWIARHERLGRRPLFAAGAWTWNRFWAALPRAFATMKPGMQAAREAGLKEVFLTSWGDNGGECMASSMFPAVQFFADLAYGHDEPGKWTEEAFRGSCNGDFKAWMMASELDYYPALGDPSEAILNTAKWVLWHDPLVSYLEQHVFAGLPEHYRDLCERLSAFGDEPELEFPRQLARVAALKSELHLALRQAYQGSNRSELARLQTSLIPDLFTEIGALRGMHRSLWMRESKPFGWEVLDIRYGGLLSRLETLQERLGRYLEGCLRVIEELEAIPCPVYPPEVFPKIVINHRKAATPSIIS